MSVQLTKMTVTTAATILLDLTSAVAMLAIYLMRIGVTAMVC